MVHLFVVDFSALPVKLLSDPAISIGGPFSCHGLDGLFQVLVFFLNPGRLTALGGMRPNMDAAPGQTRRYSVPYHKNTYLNIFYYA